MQNWLNNNKTTFLIPQTTFFLHTFKKKYNLSEFFNNFLQWNF